MQFQFLMQRRCHFRVRRGHDLLIQFRHRHSYAAFSQAFGHFQTDISAADHNRPLWFIRIDSLDNRIHICQVTQGIDVGAIRARHRRTDGFGPGTENQVIVAFDTFSPIGQIFNDDLLLLAVDTHHLGPNTYIECKPFSHRFRRLHQQSLAFGNDAADMVGQAAVGKRNIRPAFNHDNFCRFAHASCPCCRRCSACDTPDDNNLWFAFHIYSLHLSYVLSDISSSGLTSQFFRMQ